MKVSEIMTQNVISLREDESAFLAAKLLERNHVGALPVCDDSGRVTGILTDRDVVTRCIALSRNPRDTPVSKIMTRQVAVVQEKTEVSEAAAIMGRQQIRRIPVVNQGKLSGIVSLCDVARVMEAEPCLREISEGISRR